MEPYFIHHDRSTALRERRRRRAHFQSCGLKSKSPLALSRWFCYLCPLRSSCRTPYTPPSSAQESALPGAPAPTRVPRHLKVTKPSHSHLKEENDKFPKPSHPRVNHEAGKTKETQRSHGDGGCRVVPVSVQYVSGSRQGRITEAEGVSRTGKNARLCSLPGL